MKLLSYLMGLWNLLRLCNFASTHYVIARNEQGSVSGMTKQSLYAKSATCQKRLLRTSQL
jgi:hypothetical protein